MARDLLRVLDAGADQADERLGDVDDAVLSSLYEALVWAPALDDLGARWHGQGRIPFFVPAGSVATIACGAASALTSSDWLYPSLRDFSAVLLRGGSIEEIAHQFLGNGADTSLGRQIPGAVVLPEGRYFASVPGKALHVEYACGTALALSAAGNDRVSLASFGVASLVRGNVQRAARTAVRAQAPLVLVCRSRSAERVDAECAALGLEVTSVDGHDPLAVRQAVVVARTRALGGQPSLVEAVADGSATAAPDTVPLRSLLEHRGLWDAERDQDLRDRIVARTGVAAALAEQTPAVDAARLGENVTQDGSWVLDEQSHDVHGSGAAS